MATRKGDAPWWAFLVGAIIIIVVVIVMLAFYGKVHISSESVIGGIGNKLGDMFK